MREIIIVISDLYLAAGDGPSVPAATATLPGLEQAVRFGQKKRLESGWRAWLARRAGRGDLADSAPAAVAAAASSETSEEGGTVWFATPIHLIAGMASLHLDYRGFLELPAEDLTRLAQDFVHTFRDTQFRLRPLESGTLLLRSRGAVNAVTTEPSRALAYELQAALPSGPDAAVLKRLGAELEMWLHGHPVNDARARRGEPPVSTLWLWGGGPVLQPGAPAPPSAGQALVTVFGCDAYVVGLSRLNAVPLRPLPERLPNPLECPDGERAVVIAAMTPLLRSNPNWTLFDALACIDSHFIEPAIAQLRRGDVASVVLLANDTQLHIRRGDPLRFWRRRPKSGSDALRKGLS